MRRSAGVAGRGGAARAQPPLPPPSQPQQRQPKYQQQHQQRQAVSGDLLYRTGGLGQSRLFARTKGALQLFLDEDLEPGAVLQATRRALQHVHRARAQNSAFRHRRARGLQHLLVQAQQRVELDAVQQGVDCRAQTVLRQLKRLLAELEGRLVRLVMCFYAVLEAEKGLVRAQLAKDLWQCSLARNTLRTVHAFRVLGFHMQGETRAKIKLERLDDNNPQCMRCKKAACENIKTGFFDENSAFVGLDVVDVYKIENKMLMELFQQSAAQLGDQAKVKGLFSHIPTECVEHVIVHGFFADATHMAHTQAQLAEAEAEQEQARAKAAATAEDGGDDGGEDDDPHRRPRTSTAASGKKIWRQEDPFKQSWLEKCRPVGDDLRARDIGYAKREVERSTPVPFPRAFSRYSTLEEIRTVANEPEERVAQEERGLFRRLMADSAGGVQQDNHSAMDLNVQQSVSGTLRYLILCRVLVGRVYVGSQNADAPPPVGGEFDSIYMPFSEEYRLLRPWYILPEFVVQFRLRRRPTPETPFTLQEDSARQVFPVDLATSQIDLPAAPGRPPRSRHANRHDVDDTKRRRRGDPPDVDTQRTNAAAQRHAVVSAIQENFTTFWQARQRLLEEELRKPVQLLLQRQAEEEEAEQLQEQLQEHAQQEQMQQEQLMRQQLHHQEQQLQQQQQQRHHQHPQHLHRQQQQHQQRVRAYRGRN